MSDPIKMDDVESFLKFCIEQSEGMTRCAVIFDAPGLRPWAQVYGFDLEAFIGACELVKLDCHLMDYDTE